MDLSISGEAHNIYEILGRKKFILKLFTTQYIIISISNEYNMRKLQNIINNIFWNLNEKYVSTLKLI